MRSFRSLVLAVVVALLAPLVGVVALTGSASAAESTELTITGKPKRGVYNDEIGPASTPDVVQHKGRLTTTGGAGIANAEVQLQRKLVGGDWQFLDGQTDENGRYEFVTGIEGNAVYQVVFAGNAVYAASQSGQVKVKAMRDFNAELGDKNKRGVVLKGNINPGWDEKPVQWQRKKCKTCKWSTIDSERSGKNGAWSFRGAYPPVNKKWFYRARLGKTKEFVESFSAVLITTTTPARGPAARAVRLGG